jgi:hypothetical protein
MAQRKRRFTYNYLPEALGVALRVLRCASGAWAFHSESAPTVDKVLALVIRCLVCPSQSGGMPLALKLCIDRVGMPADECARSTGKLSPKQLAVVLAEPADALTAAAKQWAADGPEDPPTERVLHELADTMFRHGLVRTPPPGQIDG